MLVSDKSSGEERLAMRNVFAAGSSRYEPIWRRKDGSPVFTGISGGAPHHKDGRLHYILCSKRRPVGSDLSTLQSSRPGRYFAMPELLNENQKLLKEPVGMYLLPTSPKGLSLRARVPDGAIQNGLFHANTRLEALLTSRPWSTGPGSRLSRKSTPLPGRHPLCTRSLQKATCLVRDQSAAPN